MRCSCSRLWWALWLLISTVHAEGLRVGTFEARLPMVRASEIVLATVYQRAGIELDIVYLPGQRSLLSARTGVLDGDLVRYDGVESNAPELTRLPHAIGFVRIVAYAKQPRPLTEGWRGLREDRVGLLNGFVIAEQNTQGFQRELVDSQASLFRMLDLGRIDIAILSELDRLLLPSLADIRGEIVPLQPHLEEIALYHYVHHRRKAMIERLTQTMAVMAASGELGELLFSARMQVADEYGAEGALRAIEFAGAGQ